MKSIMKVMVRSTFLVIGMAMAIFCITSMVFDIKNGGSFHMENYQFTKGFWAVYSSVLALDCRLSFTVKKTCPCLSK